MGVSPNSSKAVRVISGEALWSFTPSSSLTPTTNAAIDGASSIVPLSSAPATDTANGKYVIRNEDATTLNELMFVGTDAANETGTAMVRGWYEMSADSTGTKVWFPVHLADLAFTLGAVQLGSNVGELTTNLFWADTITVTNDYSRGDLTKVYGEIADGISVVALDGCGAHYIEVECAIGTAASVMPVFGRL